MIRHPLGLRINPARPVREQIYEAARIGARGVVLDAIGDLAQRLSETGRRELRHLLRTVELSLVALSLPTRRPFDTTDQLDERIRRADGAFALAYELGTNLVLARVGPVPGSGRGAARRLHQRARLAGAACRPPGRQAGDRYRYGARPEAPGLPRLARQRRPRGQHRSRRPAACRDRSCDYRSRTRRLGGARLRGRAGGSPSDASTHPRGFGFSPGVLDWENYLGSLEEIGYSGSLTIWPDPAGDARGQFLAVVQRLNQLS